MITSRSTDVLAGTNAPPVEGCGHRTYDRCMETPESAGTGSPAHETKNIRDGGGDDDGESTLIAELQRRCDKIIELEVLLDQERERANRLECSQHADEEALSGELRDIMASVAGSTTTIPMAITKTTSATTYAQERQPSLPSQGRGNGGWLTVTPTALLGTQSARGRSRETAELSPRKGITSERSAAGDTPVGFVGLGLESMSDARPDVQVVNDGSTAFVVPISKTRERVLGVSEGQAVSFVEGVTAETPHMEVFSSSQERDHGVRLREEMEESAQRQQQQQGALRARVVELELQRQEAVDALKVQTDRSLRLEVQVEQLKNVVQSLSHTSSIEAADGWGEGSFKTNSPTPGTSDLSPLLRDTPGVDPSVMLLLHRTPWADGVSEGIRTEEAVFEWQGIDSQGEWSSKHGCLPHELTSLPPYPTQLITATALQSPSRQLEQHSASSSRSISPQSSFSPQGRGRVSRRQPEGGEARPADLAAGVDVGRRGTARPRSGSGGKLEGLKERIGEAVAGFGGSSGRWTGGNDGGSLVTDAAMTGAFSLGDVQVPSQHWEWIGGWMLDSETETSTDPDGWVYGDTPSEISAIASGEKGRNVLRNDPETSQGNRAGSGAWNSSGNSSSEGGSDVLRRRRLVRLRMVTRVDGARESTKSFLETLRRLSSLEILVRKLSRQVVTLHRQVTAREAQAAFLAPLEPKLRQACAMGRRDRYRGDALQRKLIEAENELKVLRRCMGNNIITNNTNTNFGSQSDPTPPAQSSNRADTGSATHNTPNQVTLLPSSANSDLVQCKYKLEDRQGLPVPESQQGGRAAGGAWGWVGGVAQRAAGSLTRRPANGGVPTPAERFDEREARGRSAVHVGGGVAR